MHYGCACMLKLNIGKGHQVINYNVQIAALLACNFMCTVRGVCALESSNWLWATWLYGLNSKHQNLPYFFEILPQWDFISGPCLIRQQLEGGLISRVASTEIGTHVALIHIDDPVPFSGSVYWDELAEISLTHQPLLWKSQESVWSKGLH